MLHIKFHQNPTYDSREEVDFVYCLSYTILKLHKSSYCSKKATPTPHVRIGNEYKNNYLIIYLIHLVLF